jgi:peptidoglycan/LPS O-acetylase OafA/YrhL
MTDAGFEAVLGTVLVMGYVFGQIDEDDFADPVSGGISALFGLALIALAVGLAELVKRNRTDDRVLGALAAGNAGFAVLIAIWVLASDDFSSGGRTLVWVTVAALLLLAAVQAALVVRR